MHSQMGARCERNGIPIDCYTNYIVNITVDNNVFALANPILHRYQYLFFLNTLFNLLLLYLDIFKVRDQVKLT